MEPDFKKNYCPDLFSWKDLTSIVNIRPLMDVVRVNVLNGPECRWDNDPWTHNVNTWPPYLLKDVIENHICYITEMSRCSEKVNEFAGSLEQEYNMQCDAHIYTCRNPEIDHPFGIHFDYSDNVIVQCEGTTNFKVWKLWNEIGDHNQNHINLEIDEEPIIDVEMNPGDAIWIPRYHPHLATSKSTRMSVSFPLIYRESKVFQDRNWIKL